MTHREKCLLISKTYLKSEPSVCEPGDQALISMFYRLQYFCGNIASHEYMKCRIQAFIIKIKAPTFDIKRSTFTKY